MTMTRDEFREWLTGYMMALPISLEDMPVVSDRILLRAAQVEPTMNSTAFALKGTAAILRALADDLMRKQGMSGLLEREERTMRLETSNAVDQALDLAGKEAMRRKAGAIGTEHLLLGLMDQEGTAAGILASLGIDAARLRQAVNFVVGPGE